MAVPSAANAARKCQRRTSATTIKPSVENGNVTEQAERIVLAGRKQNRREKTAQHAEDGDDQCVQPDRQQEGRRRDERHQEKGRQRPKKFKMVNRAAGKSDGIKNDDAGRAQRLRKYGEIFPRHHHAADEQAETSEKPDGDAQFRRDEIVVE